MQKARIISASIEDANLFAEQLRAEGFAVEVTEPGDTPLPEVDLEIVLEHCSQEAAMDRAAEIAHLRQADIYVAPETFEKAPPTASDAPLLQPSVVDTINGIAAGLKNKRDLMAKALREQRALARQNRLSRSAQTESATRDWGLLHADTGAARRQQEGQPKSQEERGVRLHDLAVTSLKNQSQPMSKMIGGQRKRATWSRTRELRAAFAIAAVCAITMMVLWAAVPRQLSGANGLKTVEQKLPFGSTTLKPVQTPLAQEPDRSQSPATAPTQSPLPVTRKATKPGAASVSDQTLANEEHEMVAEDQVVYIGPRHVRRDQTRPPAPQRASVRRYSDME